MENNIVQPTFEGHDIYYRTPFEAVYDKNGNTLEDRLSQTTEMSVSAGTGINVNKTNNTYEVVAKILDILTSEDTTSSLSAAQGKALKDLIDDLTEKYNRSRDYMYVRQTSDIVWTASQSPAPYMFHTLASYRGSSFTRVSSSAIRVNSGVTRVKVTVHVNKNETDSAEKWLMGYIYKNSTMMIRTINSCHRWQAIDTTCVFDVEEGDQISFRVASDYSGNMTFPTYDSFGSCGGMNFMLVENYS